MDKIVRSWKEFVPKLWTCLKLERYTFSIFKKDLGAGVTVGIVTLPLAMAFAIASGVTPAQGIYTAIIAGFLISFLGGSRVQIGGPTGAFVVIVYDIILRQGYQGLVIATLLAGILLLLMGFFRLGSLIKYIPYPLITGFTSGIALVIFSSQIKDFLGLEMGTPPADFIAKWSSYFQNLHTLDPTTCMVAAGTLVAILCVRRFFPVAPWGVVAIVGATLVCTLFGIRVETIHSRFGDLPSSLPTPTFAFLKFDFKMLHTLIPDAVVIALLAGIESLLSAVVADGMTGGRHKSNCELVAQGFANLASVAFGGIPATGAIARTATNIKSGAKTPVAGMMHSITLFVIIFAFAPIVSLIPLPALSAVLIIIAWNMSEIDHFRHLLKAPKGDVAVLLITFLLTVFIDLTVAIEVGMVLAAFLFMKRMSDISKTTPIATFIAEENGEVEDNHDPDAIAKKHLPAGVEVYEINGPFFFGVADSLKDVLRNLEFPPKIFILRMRKVPVIDASGMHALQEFYLKCKKEGTKLLLSGVQEGPAKSLKKFGLEELIGKAEIFPHIDAALKRAQELVETK